MEEPAGYELVDVGDGRRLERFGSSLVDRPAAAASAPKRLPEAWPDADLRVGPADQWTSRQGQLRPWVVSVGGIRLELRPTETGQVGLFPEQLGQLGWLRDRVVTRAGPGRDPPRVLNLFAYTGLATLALAAAGAAVAHVDGSRPSVAWARRNADLSGLADRPVRWLVDDARRFVEREARRGRTYDGIVLDPPSHGHGEGGRAWRLEHDLAPLLAACLAVLEPDGFALLTAHTPGFGPDRLAEAVAVGLARSPTTIDAGELVLTATSGARLPLGAFARVAR